MAGLGTAFRLVLQIFQRRARVGAREVNSVPARTNSEGRSAAPLNGAPQMSADAIKLKEILRCGPHYIATGSA